MNLDKENSDTELAFRRVVELMTPNNGISITTHFYLSDWIAPITKFHTVCPFPLPLTAVAEVLLPILLDGAIDREDNTFTNFLIPKRMKKFSMDATGAANLQSRWRVTLMALQRRWSHFGSSLLLNIAERIVREGAARREDKCSTDKNQVERRQYFLGSWLRFLFTREWISVVYPQYGLYDRRTNLSTKPRHLWMPHELQFMTNIAPHSAINEMNYPLNSIVNLCIKNVCTESVDLFESIVSFVGDGLVDKQGHLEKLQLLRQQNEIYIAGHSASTKSSKGSLVVDVAPRSPPPSSDGLAMLERLEALCSSMDDTAHSSEIRGPKAEEGSRRRWDIVDDWAPSPIGLLPDGNMPNLDLPVSINNDDYYSKPKNISHQIITPEVNDVAQLGSMNSNIFEDKEESDAILSSYLQKGERKGSRADDGIMEDSDADADADDASIKPKLANEGIETLRRNVRFL